MKFSAVSFLLLSGLSVGVKEKAFAAAAPTTSCAKPFGSWTRPTNTFSLAEYSDHRATCTAVCNANDFCCTKDIGLNNVAPCTTGCHIAWSSTSVEECKAECDLAVKADHIHEFIWDYDQVAELGLHAYEDMKLHMGLEGKECGCPIESIDDSGEAIYDNGEEGSDQACKRGCEFANEMSIRANFYHGKSVTVDPHIDLSLSTLMSAIAGIKGHVEGSATLSKTQLSDTLTNFLDNAELLEKDFAAMDSAFEVIASYEAIFEPLFLNSKTAGGFERKNDDDDLILERIILAMQQSVFDEVFQGSLTVAESQGDSIIENCAGYFNGRAWQTSRFFPGWVDAPSTTDQTIEYTAKIDASVPTYWGKKVCFADEPALRPTGLYLTPGGVATVVVPSSLVNKGFRVAVGAAEADHSEKDYHSRMDRVVARYKVTSTTTHVANPLGGGIYIIVPYEASEGIQDIVISGSVVEAPFFSMTNFKTTSAAEWDRLRTSEAPWADFMTTSFFMQIPTSWTIKYDYDHFLDLLAGRSKAMAAASRFVGIPIENRNDYLSYVQPDLQIKHDAFGIGYPQVNVLVFSGENGPVAPEPGAHDWLVDSKYIDDAIYWHELGHCIVPFDYYEGETEAIVNILKAYIDNTLVGVDFDTAFAESFTDGGTFTPDRAAMHWMVTPNFRIGLEMDHSNTERDEMRYQERGYAKYADIARLFGGWETVIKFFSQNQLNFIDRENKDTEDVDQEGLDRNDYRTLMLSKAAGTDLTPLIHFWGIQPSDKEALKFKMQENSLSVSTTVQDQLSRYASLVPKNNAEFRKYATDLFPQIADPDWVDLACPSPLYGCGWFSEWINQYGDAEGAQGVAAVNAIIDLYFAVTPPSPSNPTTPVLTPSPTPIPTPNPTLIPTPSPSKPPSSPSPTKAPEPPAPTGTGGKVPRFFFAGQSNMEGNFDQNAFDTTFQILYSSTNDEFVFSSLLAHLKLAESSPLTSDERYQLEATELIRLKNEGILASNFLTPLSTVDCSFYQLDFSVDYRDGTREPAILALDEALGPSSRCGEPFGPELMFGHAMNKCDAQPISIVKVAGGGTELERHWSKDDGWFWGEVVERIQDVDTNKEEWKGIVWFQGENDALADEVVVEEYESLLAKYIFDLRQEMFSVDNTVFADPSEIPVVIVGVGCWIAGSGDVWNGPKILEAQTQFAAKDAKAVLVTTNDLSCHYHFDDASHIIIGHRVAEAIKTFESISCGESKPTPIPTSIPPLTPAPITTSPTPSPTPIPTPIPTPSPSRPPSSPSPIPTSTPPTPSPPSPPPGGGGCFSATNQVEVQDKGIVSMDSIQIGDKVRSRNGGFSTVYSLAHKDRGLGLQYIQIHADTMGRPLEISVDHMLYVRQKGSLSVKLLPAGHVATGDHLLAPPGNMSGSQVFVVQKINTVERIGAYAPYTYSGDIVVNGIVASTYISFPELPVSWKTQEWIQNMLNGPRRLVCQQSLAWCKQETYSRGYASGVIPQQQIAAWFFQQKPFVKILFVYAFSLPCLSILWVLETIFSSRFLFSSALLGTVLLMTKKSGRNAVQKNKIL